MHFELMYAFRNVARIHKQHSFTGGVPEFVQFGGLQPERRYTVAMSGIAVTSWRCGPARPVFGVVPEHIMTVNTLPLVPTSCAFAFVSDWRAESACKVRPRRVSHVVVFLMRLLLQGEQTLWLDIDDMCSRAWHGVDAVVHVGGVLQSDATIRRALLMVAFWRDMTLYDALRDPSVPGVPLSEEETIEAALREATPHEPPRLAFGAHMDAATLALLRCSGQFSVLPPAIAARYCSFGHAQLHQTTLLAEGAGLGMRAHAVAVVSERCAGSAPLVRRPIPLPGDEQPVPVGDGGGSCIIHRRAAAAGYEVCEGAPPSAVSVSLAIDVLLRDTWRAELTSPYARGAMMRASQVVLPAERDWRITVPQGNTPSPRFTVKLASVMSSAVRRVRRPGFHPPSAHPCAPCNYVCAGVGLVHPASVERRVFACHR